MNLTRFEHISPIDILFLRELPRFPIELCKERLILRPLRYVVVWKGERDSSTNYPTGASTSIDALQHNAQCDGDNTLVALVRLSSLFQDACKAMNERDAETSQNRHLILIGLEQQYRELQHSMHRHILGSGTSNGVDVSVIERD